MRSPCRRSRRRLQRRPRPDHGAARQPARRARRRPLASHLLRQPPAWPGDGPALCAIRPAGRPRVRCRRPRGRPRRRLPPVGRPRGRDRAAARAGAHAAPALRPRRRRHHRAGRARRGRRHGRAPAQHRQSDRLDSLRGLRRRRTRRARLGRTGLDPARQRAADDARCAHRTARHAELHQARRRRVRGGGARRADATGHRAVVRVHPHPARGGACGARPLRGARLLRLRRIARRDPDAGARRLATGRRGSPLARRPAGRGQLRRHLRGAAMSWRRALPIVVLTLAGFALTLRIFYPGVMTYDAWYVHSDIAKAEVGDWQSPVQAALWGLIEHIVPGAAGMFLFIATLYWLAFATLGLALARRSAWLGALASVLALAPPAFVFAGIIWRDIMLAASWLLAAALVFGVADRKGFRRRAAQAAALALLCL